MNKELYPITFAGRRYRLNIKKINEFCFVSSGKTGKESEITEAYESDESDEFHLTSKINREIKTAGNPQEDMIVYDFVKSLVMRIIDDEAKVTATANDIDFGFALAFNTLLSEGMIEEITE